MESIETIVLTIDHLIEQTSKMTVCHDHWQLVTSRLNRLRNRMSQIQIRQDDGRLFETIAQTLEAISELVTTCCDNKTNLSGITYRELETMLLRFQTYLTQYEANLTDDYQKKVEILSKGYQEQHNLVQKNFDEMMKKRLETIKEKVKKKSVEQLRLLREKHAAVVESYLQCCVQLHNNVPLSGLTSDVVARIAHTFYGTLSDDQIRLERNWQACDLPLTRSFIQFKTDKSTSFERGESRRLLNKPDINLVQGLHSKREASKSIWQRLVSAPFMMSMVERDRYEQDEDISKENIIQIKRWIVILGDPGSGKTSFARWLVRHLAEILLDDNQTSTDYGPIRIPILIRIGEFAELLSKNPSLTLFDYIGNHKWMGKAIVQNSSISVDNISSVLQDYIREGQALIILDGLDEIPVSDLRSKIINCTENFVENYVQALSGVSAFDDPYLSKLSEDSSQSGGNQLIVTSRIVGYHAAPLAGQFAHYTIRPMDTEHMKDFVDYWFFHVHQQILGTLELNVDNRGEDHNTALKEELEKTENKGLLDVASNSCLLSFICSVAFSQSEGSSLPTQRILLYEKIVNSMLSLWSNKGSTINVRRLMRILSDIATYIHKNSASGLIHENDMKKVCIHSIKSFINKKQYTEDDLRAIEDQASEFVRIIRDDVGILAARGESLYGFLHLTFQEYYTCLQLIDTDKLEQEASALHDPNFKKKVQLIAQSLRRHMNDPRFRVPIALALGKLSTTLSNDDFDKFCLEFIKEENNSISIMPIGAYILISCGNDLVNYPSNKVLFDAMDQLIIAAGQHKWSVNCPFLFDQLINAIKKLQHNTVSAWIYNILSRSPRHDIQTISALCHLIEGEANKFDNIKWLDQSSCSILQSLSQLDDENNEFAIDRLLVKIAASPEQRLLSVHPGTFKEFLLTKEIEMDSIPVALISPIIVLYGGLKRDDKNVVFDPFRIYRESKVVTSVLVLFLSKNNSNKHNETVSLIKKECTQLLLSKIQNHDESSETVDLCIAISCLYGINYVRENNNIIPNSILRKSFGRLKYIAMIIRQFYAASVLPLKKQTTDFIANVIEKFPDSNLSKVSFLVLLDSMRSSLARLACSNQSILFKEKELLNSQLTLFLPDTLRREHVFLNNILFTDIKFDSDRKSCSLLYQFTKLFWVLEHNEEYETQYRMAEALDQIPEYLQFRNDEDLLFPLTFVSPHLQNLYAQLLKKDFFVIHSRDSVDNSKPYLCYAHILCESLMVLSNISCKRLSILGSLGSLLPCLRMHQLDNFASSLFWILATKDISYLNNLKNMKEQPLNYETGLYINKKENFDFEQDMTSEERRILIDQCIEQEHQRYNDSLHENNRTSTKMYSTCVTLAQICRWDNDVKRLHTIEQCVHGAMLIKNKTVRFDALCMIAFYCHSDYNQIKVSQQRSLQEEIEYQLNNIYPDLPLLLHTVILIRCLPLLQQQQTIDECLQNLLQKFVNAETEDQQVVYEALVPYFKSTFDFSSLLKSISNDTNFDHNKTIANKLSVLQEYLIEYTDGNLSSSLSISNLYLVELASELHQAVSDYDLCSLVSQLRLPVDHALTEYKLFKLQHSMLTTAQVLTITNILTTISSSNYSEKSKQICIDLNKALHRFDIVEFKGCRLLESWMKWKDSNELSSFAFHAALLLTKSDFWSVEAANIVCDLLLSENDRIRQRAEMILKTQSDDNEVRTSSKLGIDVLIALAAKRTYYQHSSPSANLTLNRMFSYITFDVQSHVDTFLWIERYKQYKLLNKDYSLDKSTMLSNCYIVPFLFIPNMLSVSIYELIDKCTIDILRYVCSLIEQNFISFMSIDGDTTSHVVVESHNQFIVSVLVWIGLLIFDTDDARAIIIDSLINLIKASNDDQIHRAAISALGYICKEDKYRLLFELLEIAMESENHRYEDSLVCALITSYCHCLAINAIDPDSDDMELFRKLLRYPSANVIKTIRLELGRVLNGDESVLFDMLDSDYIQYYHTLINSTAYTFAFVSLETSVNAASQFIEQHPELLSIFATELYNSIRHYSNNVLHIKTMEFFMDYGYCHCVEVAGALAERMPASLCAFIRDWHDGDNLKRALFHTSKQHNFLQRAACLTILSIFGELTVELCEMIVEGLRDDPHIQNMCFKCLSRMTSIKDEKAVLDKLFFYLRSRSMNVRYIVAKIFLHLARSSLISSKQVQTILNDMMSDTDSNEDLWLIEEQDDIQAECAYFYAGSLKDVIYSLLVQHLTGDACIAIRRNELNDIDLDFTECEKASRLASCIYGTLPKEKPEKDDQSSRLSLLFDYDEDSKSNSSSSTEYEDNENKISQIDEPDNAWVLSACKQSPIIAVDAPIENITTSNDIKNEDHLDNNIVQNSTTINDTSIDQSLLQTKPIPKKKSRMCVII